MIHMFKPLCLHISIYKRGHILSLREITLITRSVVPGVHCKLEEKY